jgi:hypothetical protein
MVELVADLIKEGADVNDHNHVSLKCARNRARLCCCAGAALLSSSFSRIHLKYTRVCREQAVRSSDYWTVYKFVASQSLHNTNFLERKSGEAKDSAIFALFFFAS